MVDRPEGPTLTKTYGREKIKEQFLDLREKEKRRSRKRVERSNRLRLKEQGAGGQERKKELKNRQYRYYRYHLLFSARLHPFNKSDQQPDVLIGL